MTHRPIEETTDAVTRIASAATCGSHRHLDEVLGLFNEPQGHHGSRAHGRRGPAGTISMTIIEDEEGDLRVEVRDRGRWLPEREGTSRGRGTGIMSSLTRDFARTTDESGTTVRFTFPVRSAEKV